VEPQTGAGSASALILVGVKTAVRNNAEASTISFLFTTESPFQGNCVVIMCGKRWSDLRWAINFKVPKT